MLQMKNAALEDPRKKNSHALRCLNLTFPDKGLVVITGTAHSGKTALLHLIAMSDRPSRGEIRIGGENTSRWNEKRRSSWRRECAAADETRLFRDMTLLQNAEQSCVLAGFRRKDARQNALAALRCVGLESFADAFPDSLSGSERKLASLACALSRDAKVVLLDEPTDGLTADEAEKVLSFLREESENRLIVAAARDAMLFGDDARVITLEEGQVISDTGDDAEETSSGYSPVAGVGALESIRMAFSNLNKKKSRFFLRTFAPFTMVLLLSLLFAVMTGGQKTSAETEASVLSSYPVTLTKDSIASGNLSALADWLDTHTDEESISVQRSYEIAPRIYSGDSSADTIVRLNGDENEPLWTQLPEGENLRRMRYTLVSGRWPERYDEAVVLLDINGRVDDACLTALGLDPETDADISYTEMLRLAYRVMLPTDEYVRNVDGTWGYMGSDETYMKAQIAASQRLNIVGILRPVGETPGENLTGGAAYLPELSEWTVETLLASELVQAQTAAPETDVLTGLPFDTAGVYTQDEAQQRAALQKYALGCTPDEQAAMYAALSGMTVETERAQDALLQTIASLTTDTLREAFAKYISSGISPSSYAENMQAFGALAAQTVTELRLYSNSFSARETLGTVLNNYSETVTYTDAASGIIQPGLTLTENVKNTDKIGFVLAAVLAAVSAALVSALAAHTRLRELKILFLLGMDSPQIVIGWESAAAGLFGSVLGAAAAYLLCLLSGGIAALNLTLSWQSAVILAAASTLITWLSAVAAASSFRKKA